MTSALTPMEHLHALIFSCWFLLLIVQGRPCHARTHRPAPKARVAGWFLAGIMIPSESCQHSMRRSLAQHRLPRIFRD